MAILQISKIQHRRGLKENLPQLASGELGWSIDTRQLFVGNGTIEEGAPALGNTEILTEFSNLFEIGNSYTLRELAPGLTANGTVGRTLQSKLDDVINARDFGCAGDGETDDTEAINNLFFRVYCDWENEEVRRTVYFPAGTYVTNGETIKIPTWARVVGDGIDSTIIKREDSGLVFELADSNQQVGGSIGISGGVRPQNIDIIGITFQSTDGDVAYITSARNIYFSRVKLQGPLVQPGTTVENYRGVFIESTPVLLSEQVIFDSCEWNGLTYALVANDDINNVVISNSVLTNLYKGIVLGQQTTGSGSSILGPRGFKITCSFFDAIAEQAIHVYQGQHTVSAFNYFRDVANEYLGAGNPAAPVIQFNVGGHSSIGDQFDRDDTDDLTFARVTTRGISAFGLISGSEMQFGSARQRAGFEVTLEDDTSTATSTGIELDGDSYPVGAFIDYSISRNSAFRVGTIRIAHGTGPGPSVVDEYVESNGSCGITLSFANSGNGTEVNYISTSTGIDAVLRYQVRYLF